MTNRILMVMLISFIYLNWTKLTKEVKNVILALTTVELNISEESTRNADDKVSLFIGIMSSPDNFRQRQSLRRTWLSLLPDSVQYTFVIGNQDCAIHPLDRKSSYSCEEVHLFIPETYKKDYNNNMLYSNTPTLPKSCDGHINRNIGFNFLVQYPITMQYLGLQKKIIALNQTMSTIVILTDSQTGNVLSSVEFTSSILAKDSTENDYFYMKLTNPILLPKGFEGSIKVEKLNGSIQDIDNETINSEEWTHGNFISVSNMISQSSCKINSYCGMSTFIFSFKGLDEFNFYVKEKQLRHLEWTQHTEDLRSQLRTEANLHKDIVEFQMIDIYRNLPKKVLLFFKWVYANHEVDYVLKTDDDTFIDVKKVKRELDKPSSWDWWSCFRIGWPVQRQGKWRETIYKEMVYPPFPSGAGYVLSQNILAWINNRTENLTINHQGEDVSLGIWLDGQNFSRHVGSECYWACSTQCHSRTCNAMQLSVDGVYNLWTDYKECGYNICRCPS